MTRANTKSQETQEQLDTRHDLSAQETAGQRSDGTVENQQSGTEPDRTRAERDALLERLARTQAEFETTRKRISREQQDFKDFALAEALKSLLPSLDSFDWALQAPARNLEEFRGGVDLIRRQLHDTLSKLGLQPIPAKGQPFDPRLHEAVEVVENSAAPDNQVVEELQRGYKLRDRLLRPAMVLVARRPQTPGEEASTEPRQ